LLVLADLAGSAYLAASAGVPDPVPDFALQAASVYRLEVSAASFVVLYLATMAIFLALDGRGFAELGTRGLRATEVVSVADAQRRTFADQLMLIRDMEKDLEEAKAALHDATDRLNEQEQRVRRLEEER
jgi:hypothetical protein